MDTRQPSPSPFMENPSLRTSASPSGLLKLCPCFLWKCFIVRYLINTQYTRTGNPAIKLTWLFHKPCEFYSSIACESTFQQRGHQHQWNSPHIFPWADLTTALDIVLIKFLSLLYLLRMYVFFASFPFNRMFMRFVCIGSMQL